MRGRKSRVRDTAKVSLIKVFLQASGCKIVWKILDYET